MTHILVKNNRIENGWDYFEQGENSEFVEILDTYQIQTLEIPYFPDMSQIDYLDRPFYLAIDSGDLKPMQSQRTKVFLRESFDAISELEPLHYLKSRLDHLS